MQFGLRTLRIGDYMTTNTPALAQDAVLTDEEIRSFWVEHGLDDEAVEDFARALESALLSKLRAPVADERAAFEAFQRGVGLNELYLERHPESGQYMWTATKEAWETWQARAALASAPVAGEAQRPHLNIVLDHAADRLAEAGMREDASIVRGMKVPNDGSKTESINAAPQASEAVRLDADALDLARAGMELHSPGMPEHTVCAELVRLAAALSAQPGAQKNGGSDA